MAQWSKIRYGCSDLMIPSGTRSTICIRLDWKTEDTYIVRWDGGTTVEMKAKTRQDAERAAEAHVREGLKMALAALEAP